MKVGNVDVISMEQGIESSSSSIYTKLDTSKPQIRVLTLLPANHENDDIRCQLRTVSRAEDSQHQEEYEALSYTWGEPCKNHTIYIDETPFKVTKNLYFALRFLRKSSFSRTLWIDAICINQIDIDERNHQVRHMRGIYAGAHQVLAWLGEPDEDTDRAMDVLLHLSESGYNYADISAHIDSTDEYEDVIKLKKLYAPVFTGIRKLLKRPWWNRVWIVQETSVAPKRPLAGCGWKWTPIDIFMVVRLSLWGDREINHSPLPEDFPKVNLMVQEDSTIPQAWCQQLKKQERSAPLSLGHLLLATNRRDASDPRDKILAVIALSQSENDKFLLPDYSLHVSEVYQRAMLTLLSSDMGYLDCVAAGKEIQLPSWCTDFSTKEWYNRRHELAFPKVRGRASGSRSQPPIFHDTTKHGITLSGVVIGVVQYSVQRDKIIYSDENMETDEQIAAKAQKLGSYLLEDMLSFTIKSWRALHSRAGHIEACKMLARGDVWRTVLGGEGLNDLEERAGRKKSKLPENYSLLERFALERVPSWASVSRHWSHLVPDTIPTNLQRSVDSTFRVMAFVADDCTFFRTDTGYIGKAASNDVQDGDIVVVFLGSKFPHILRRDSGTSFKIISMAWVHGIMDGELMKDMDPEETQRFFVV